MKEKPDTAASGEGLTDHIEAFSETFLKLASATVIEKAVNISSVILNLFLLYLAVIFVLLFAAAGLAWWLGDIMNNRAAGFFIVAGLFLLATVLIVLFRKKTIFPFIRNLITRKIYE